jgi:hypothetical protein
VSYKEDERLKVIKMRDSLFKDPGNGSYRGRRREFVLSDPVLNLWEGIRQEALHYFERNNIGWWPDNSKLPTGHLLSSQVSCVNHLYPIRQHIEAATRILQEIDHQITEACIVDDGYVEFEFIGERQYLKERAFTRGANCTSVDAVMIGLTIDGTRKMFFIEWKYVESYPIQNKYKKERAKVYDEYILAEDSPFRDKIEPRDLYYEPFYQLMRQTLLADQCVKNSDHDVSSYLHLHVVPEKNIELKNKITSPNLKGKDIHDVWKSLLKNDTKFKATTPEYFVRPISTINATISIIRYLENRYWN